MQVFRGASGGALIQQKNNYKSYDKEIDKAFWIPCKQNQKANGRWDMKGQIDYANGCEDKPHSYPFSWFMNNGYLEIKQPLVLSGIALDL